MNLIPLLQSVSAVFSLNNNIFVYKWDRVYEPRPRQSYGHLGVDTGHLGVDTGHLGVEGGHLGVEGGHLVHLVVIKQS